MSPVSEIFAAERRRRWKMKRLIILDSLGLIGFAVATFKGGNADVILLLWIALSLRETRPEL